MEDVLSRLLQTECTHLVSHSPISSPISSATTATVTPSVHAVFEPKTISADLSTRFPLIPPVLAALASASCHYGYSRIASRREDRSLQPSLLINKQTSDGSPRSSIDFAIQGAAAGLICSSARFVTLGLCINWLPKSVSAGAGEAAALGIFFLTQRSQGRPPAIKGSAGGLIGAKLAGLVFGSSGAAAVAAAIAGAYVAENLI